MAYLFGFAGVLRGQSTNASLTDTNIRHSSETNGVGEYFLTNLPPGRYRIEIVKPGFKTLVKPDVILHVQDALNLDFEMRVGPTSETIRVESGAPLVNTESATVSTVVDNRFVENSPLNGRSFGSLLELTPGVVLTPTAAFFEQGQFSVNGQRRVPCSNLDLRSGVRTQPGRAGFSSHEVRHQRASWHCVRIFSQ